VSDHYPIELVIETSASASRNSLEQAAATIESSAVRVGAFNVRMFGRKKVADVDVFNILVQVYSISCLVVLQYWRGYTM